MPPILGDEDARSVGASDTLNADTNRECFQEDYTMCRGIFARADLKKFSAYEFFFSANGKVVLVRAMMPMPESKDGLQNPFDNPLFDPEHEDEATEVAESVTILPLQD